MLEKREGCSEKPIYSGASAGSRTPQCKTQCRDLKHWSLQLHNLSSQSKIDWSGAGARLDKDASLNGYSYCHHGRVRKREAKCNRTW